VGWLFFAPKTGETQNAACAILIDRTGSSANVQTHLNYESFASQTIEGCRNLRSTLGIYYFDNQNQRVQQVGNETFTLYRPKTSRASVGTEMVAEQIALAESAVGKVFSNDQASAGGHGSDIITALDLTAQGLRQQALLADVDEMYLVVLTDGFQTGEEFGMQRTFKNAQVSPNVLLDKVQETGLIPDLAGVQVSFVGVGGNIASSEANLPAWYESSVKGFWQQLIDRGGGKVCHYSVVSSSLPAVCPVT
jgi:outer membrane lipoprotein SlyB